MTRVCAHCGEPMVRHYGESHRRFEARQACGTVCANKMRKGTHTGPHIRVEDVEFLLAVGVTDIPAALGVTRETFSQWLNRHPDVEKDARRAMPKQDESWRLKASCRGMVKFEDADERWQRAICRGKEGVRPECPVRRECLEFALSVETAYSAQFGVMYGGLTGTERAKLIRRRELRTA